MHCKGASRVALESNLVTHSASPRTWLTLASSASDTRDVIVPAPTRPSSRLTLCRPCPRPSPRSPSSSPRSPQTMPTSPCSLVRATSSRHHSSRQPRVMHVVLDTSSIVPRPRTYVFLGHLAVYGYIHSFPVCFVFLSLSRLVATFLSFPPLLLCHRTLVMGSSA